jgi:metallopeptidase MepB
VLVLQDAAARFLGYTNHDTPRTLEKMAWSPETVNTCLDELAAKFATSGQEEIEKMKRLKKLDLESQGMPFDSRHLYIWDRPYY